MYVPPLEAVLTTINIGKDEFEQSKTVEIPASLLQFLLKIALASGTFNEASYLAANPDVVAAMRAGAIENPRLHYIGNGYFEGRSGGLPDVDERWYLRAYPDVAEGIKARLVKSASQHFQSVGASELRAPSQAYIADAVEWGRALGKH